MRPDSADDQTILTAAYFLLRAIIGNNVVSEQRRTLVNLQRPHSGYNVLTVRGGFTDCSIFNSVEVDGGLSL